MRKLPSLKSIIAFEAAARCGSFIEAADELFLTPSAVSHQIKHLESRLGLSLFHRAHRSIELTDAGRQYAKSISQAFNMIQTATRDIERVGKSDILTIQSTPTFATKWLMPRLARFARQYEDIDVRLNASMAVADVAAGQADIVIRYGNVFPENDTVVERLPDETVAVMCAPALAEEPFDITGHPLIHSEANFYQWRDWIKQYAPHHTEHAARGPRFDRTFMSVSAAVDGMGIALESTLMAEHELADGRLVLPLGLLGTTVNNHQLVYAKAKAQVVKISAFREWLFAELAESRRHLAEMGAAFPE